MRAWDGRPDFEFLHELSRKLQEVPAGPQKALMYVREIGQYMLDNFTASKERSTIISIAAEALRYLENEE